MKKFMTLFLVISVLALSANLSAQQRKKGELCFAGGLFFLAGGSTLFGGVSLGYCSKSFGAEVNGAFLKGGAVIGGNLVAGLFDSQVFVPYATGGIWTTTSGGFGFDAGGGIKIRLAKGYGIRAEYRHYFSDAGDWGLDAIVGGISLFF